MCYKPQLCWAEDGELLWRGGHAHRPRSSGAVGGHQCRDLHGGLHVTLTIKTYWVLKGRKRVFFLGFYGTFLIGFHGISGDFIRFDSGFCGI